MINGILKDNNSNEVQNYISAKNIEINGMNLEDYLNKLKINLLEYISFNANQAFGANGLDITSTTANVANYIKFRNIKQNSSIFQINEAGNEITINELTPVSDKCFAIIMMYNEFGNNSSDAVVTNKIVVLDNNDTDIGTSSTSRKSIIRDKRNNAFTFIPIHLVKGYRIKFECKSDSDNTYWYRNNVAIIMFNDINENLLSFPI